MKFAVSAKIDESKLSDVVKVLLAAGGDPILRIAEIIKPVAKEKPANKAADTKKRFPKLREAVYEAIPAETPIHRSAMHARFPDISKSTIDGILADLTSRGDSGINRTGPGLYQRTGVPQAAETQS